MENPSGNYNKDGMQRHPMRTVVGCVLALLAGWLYPLLAAGSLMLCVYPIIITALYAWAGIVPAAVAAAGAILASVLPAQGSAAALLAGGTLLTAVLPAAAVICAAEKRMPFFHRLAVGIASQTAALLVCMMVIYLGLQIDLADMLTQGLKETLMLMPAGTVTLFLEQMGMYGMLTLESMEELTGGILTAGDVARVLEQAMDTMNYYLKQVIPSFVVSSGMLSGMASVSLSSRIWRDCGRQPSVEHVMIDRWRIPPRFVGMALTGMLAGYVMQMTGTTGAEAATMVFAVALTELLTVQGAASISRRFREVGAGVIPRIGLIVASLLLMPSFLQMVGIFSLLMGSEGIITKWMKKRIEQRESEDDEE